MSAWRAGRDRVGPRPGPPGQRPAEPPAEPRGQRPAHARPGCLSLPARVRYTPRTVPTAAITLGFDPTIAIGPDLVVRWQTIALAAVIAAVLIWAGLVARRVGLRADDLLSIVIAAVPGAVVAGRLAWIAAHPGVVEPNVWIWLDPTVGGLDLAAAVLGGIATGALIARLLGAPVGRWAHVLTVPLLLAIGAGKLSMLAGGSGQGLPTDLAWATAFVGDGPWGSLAASVPSHPAQAYEGLATLALALIVAVGSGMGADARADGRLLLVAIAAWALIRAAVSVTWRDPVVAAPLGAGGWTAVVVAGASLATAVAIAVAGRRARHRRRAADDLRWPDPETRPPF